MPSSLGAAEILVILVVALIFLGPNRLPDAARQVGRAVNEVRRWTNDTKREMRSVVGSETRPSSKVTTSANETARDPDPGQREAENEPNI